MRQCWVGNQKRDQLEAHDSSDPPDPRTITYNPTGLTDNVSGHLASSAFLEPFNHPLSIHQDRGIMSGELT